MKRLVIDVHTHPAFIENICQSPEKLKFNRDMFGLYKTYPQSLEEIFNQLDCAGVDKTVLLPIDLKTSFGGALTSNEEVKKIVDLAPERFIGFASVDPYREDALEVLEYAFKDLKLKGLKLHPSKQRFYPDDRRMEDIYKLCIKYNKPIMFHSGMSVEPDTLSKYAKPTNFEEVAYRFPELRICLGHFGWPWIQEACMLLLKYPNVYADTALLYFDNAKEFYHQVFEVDMGSKWIDRSLRHQIMFGSDEPRLEQIRMIKALKNMDMREDTLDMILGENALKFLGMEE